MSDGPDIHALAGYRLDPLEGPFVMLTAATAPEHPKYPGERETYCLGMTPRQARDLARDLARVADAAERGG